MKNVTIPACLSLLLTGATAWADDSAKLVALDKEWGSSQGTALLETLLSDDILAIGPEGAGGKAEMLADAASAEPTTGPYLAGDYKTHFLSDDVAVMVHSTSGDDPHLSMHVWHKVGGKWQVAATASTPIEK